MADADRYVPDDILLNNIVFRLPTKSLSRFRCVSKHWNRLISNPRKIFVPGQFCQSIEKVESGEYRMVMAYSPFEQVKEVSVGGTTNGLVLLILNFKPYGPCIVDMNLYNPLTRVFKKVPNPHYIHKNLAFGLCHGATQDDLKIVTLGCYKGAMSLCWGVFGVKNQSWSTISEFMGYYEFSTYAGTFLNGFMYWCVCVWKDHSSMLILALDIKEMVLSEIQVPSDVIFSITMGTINGRLCLIYQKYLSGGYQLLVMKDHGVWESCLKSTSKLSRMDYRTFRVMCILDEGKVIMKNLEENTYLILDLLKDSSERILVCTNLNQESTTQAVVYVESFCNI